MLIVVLEFVALFSPHSSFNGVDHLIRLIVWTVFPSFICFIPRSPASSSSSLVIAIVSPRLALARFRFRFDFRVERKRRDRDLQLWPLAPKADTLSTTLRRLTNTQSNELQNVQLTTFLRKHLWCRKLSSPPWIPEHVQESLNYWVFSGPVLSCFFTVILVPSTKIIQNSSLNEAFKNSDI